MWLKSTESAIELVMLWQRMLRVPPSYLSFDLSDLIRLMRILQQATYQAHVDY